MHYSMVHQNNTTTKPLNQNRMKTAVEWLENEFQEMCKDFGGVHSDFIVKFDQAKAKERSQKAEEYLKGFKDGKEYQIKLDELTFKSE